jgi:glycosyltransferase involved in cell wall biosynthesis
MGNIVNARYHRLLEQTHFLKHIPYCSKEELIKHYRDSDIFVMPSKRETFGLVYGQFPEGEVGYSVKYNSPTEVADRIEQILNNYDAISQRALSSSERYRWFYIAREYAKLYSEHKL